MLGSLLIDVLFQVRATDAKMPPDERDTAHIVIEHSGPPPEAFQSYVDESPVAAALAMQYALQVILIFLPKPSLPEQII